MTSSRSLAALLLLVALSFGSGCAGQGSADTTADDGDAAPASNASDTQAAAAPLVEMKNAVKAADHLMVAGQPSREELQAAADAGYTTVVNFRGLDEQGAWDETEFVESLGMRFIHFPITGKDDFSPERVDAFNALLDELGDEPTVLHCASGNRIGNLFALKAAWIDGADADAALEAGRNSGMRRDGLVRELLGARE